MLKGFREFIMRGNVMDLASQKVPGMSQRYPQLGPDVAPTAQPS
jgi:hypothetical protein